MTLYAQQILNDWLNNSTCAALHKHVMPNGCGEHAAFVVTVSAVAAMTTTNPATSVTSHCPCPVSHTAI
jgi:hypothetical protein